MPHSRGVAIIDSLGRHVWVSSEIPQLRGKLIGKPVLDFVVDEHQDVARAALFKALVQRRATKYSVTAGGSGVFKKFHCHIQPIREASAVVAWHTPPNPVELTHQERHVLILICEDFTNREISEMLNLKESTVDNVRRRIRRKIGARGIAGEVLWAVRNGVVS